MSDSTLKPWSQVDDDVEENGAGAITPESGLEPVRKTKTARANRSFSKVGTPWLGDLKVTPQWAFVPMGLAMIWLLWKVVFPSPGAESLPLFHGLGIAGMILISAGVLILAKISRRTAIDKMLTIIRDSSEQNSDTQAALVMEPELQPVWQGIEDQTADLKKRLSELLEAHQQLTLELTLADSQKKLAAEILNAISDPVIVTNAFGQLIQTNSKAEELFGFSSREMLRKPVKEVISHERLLRTMQQAKDADFRAAERRAEHEIGEKFYSTVIVPLKVRHDEKSEDESGHGVVAVLHDITKEHESSKKKSEFVAHVSHELRTPLSSIRAYVEMLVDGEATDEKTRGEFYDIIQSSADRLGRLIDNMLNISRIEAGTVRINKEPIAVSMAVKEAVDMMRPQAEEKKITLTEHLTPMVYRMMADRDLIYQAVLNLISNAIKYTPDGGKVNVRMTPHEENHTMLIEVSDTGVGIPKEDLPKMFEKFFRVEANKKLAKGTGLGLNLVKKIVEDIHDGQLTLTSEVGQGSTFGIALTMMAK
ncbi:MAG: cell wall metabolism sensor histidine kinase WalK [Phycisphaerales bacterium]|nr:cell wall metabolism sensor histidine kinase WalK [Phycisphaerales bacterium]